MSPPDRPPKKPEAQKPLDGIDLSDFEDSDKVAGFDLREPLPPTPPATAAPAPLAPTTKEPAPVVALDLPEAPESPAAGVSLPPPPAPVQPLPRPVAREALPAVAAPVPLATPKHEEVPSPPAPASAAIPAPPPLPPPAQEMFPVPHLPTQSSSPPAPTAASSVPMPPATAAPTPYAYGRPYYPPYVGVRPSGSPMPYIVSMGPAERPSTSGTAAALTRLRTGVLLGLSFFTVIALHHAFVALTGVSDAPGVRGHAPIGLQFLSYFIYGTALLSLGLALAAGASGLGRLSESRGEFGDKDAPAPRRAYKVIGVGLILPIVTTVAALMFMSQVQRSMPGSGTGTNLGLARLFDNFRWVALLSAAGQLAATFLIVVGLSATLKPVSTLVPRRDFRAFGALLVLGAAVNAAVTLVLYFGLFAPPTLTAPESPVWGFWLLLLGPALSALALLRLRRYLGTAGAEATRRHKTAKAAEKAAA